MGPARAEQEERGAAAVVVVGLAKEVMLTSLQDSPSLIFIITSGGEVKRKMSYDVRPNLACCVRVSFTMGRLALTVAMQFLERFAGAHQHPLALPHRLL